MSQLIKNPHYILDRMIACGITQQGLGVAVNLSSSQMSLTLNGKRECDLEELIRFSAVLGCKWLDLIPAYGIDESACFNFVKIVRARLGLSQERLAAAMGVSQPTIGRWEQCDDSVDMRALRNLKKSFPNDKLLDLI